jgi:hypothetical protein
MIEPALTMTAELAAELAANDQHRLVDPRTVHVRFSHLKAMAQSPAHCLHAMQAPDWKDSLPLRLGKGVHAMTFGDKPIAKWTGKVRRGKEWDQFRDFHEANGAVILSAKEYARSRAIADALKAHHEASLLLFAKGAEREQTILWEQLGRKRRSTPDVRTRHYVCELKTTRCAQPARFVRDGLYRGYAAQVADQMLAVEYATGHKPDKGYIVAVESEPPYAVTVFELTQRALDQGEALCRGWLERLLVCEQAGHWPGYCEAIELFDVPDDDAAMSGLIWGDEGGEEQGGEDE